MYVHDVFAMNFFSFTCYDTVSTYDTTLTILLIKYCATSDFFQHDMYDTTYGTSVVASLMSLKNIPANV
jgi:hypothetical protein